MGKLKMMCYCLSCKKAVPIKATGFMGLGKWYCKECNNVVEPDCYLYNEDLWPSLTDSEKDARIAEVTD